ncbi:MAG: hypothetical protein ABI162_06070 [Luteolibacter sp.]
MAEIFAGFGFFADFFLAVFAALTAALSLAFRLALVSTPALASFPVRTFASFLTFDFEAAAALGPMVVLNLAASALARASSSTLTFATAAILAFSLASASAAILRFASAAAHARTSGGSLASAAALASALAFAAATQDSFSAFALAFAASLAAVRASAEIFFSAITSRASSSACAFAADLIRGGPVTSGSSIGFGNPLGGGSLMLPIPCVERRSGKRGFPDPFEAQWQQRNAGRMPKIQESEIKLIARFRPCAPEIGRKGDKEGASNAQHRMLNGREVKRKSQPKEQPFFFAFLCELGGFAVRVLGFCGADPSLNRKFRLNCPGISR